MPTKEPQWRRHTDAKGREINPRKTSEEDILKHIFKAFVRGREGGQSNADQLSRLQSVMRDGPAGPALTTNRSLLGNQNSALVFRARQIRLGSTPVHGEHPKRTN